MARITYGSLYPSDNRYGSKTEKQLGAVQKPMKEDGVSCVNTNNAGKLISGKKNIYRGLALALALCGPAEAPSPGDPAEGTRPYAVLRGQNLVLMGAVLSVLLLTMILLAFCVYKPFRRR
ncbi:uncharacterized protein C12orf76 homolog [Suncus etruscus]|uniref:uncharacterized protein C12orf76 homolog n=1 Tax=Suncus etruscus TaxID=109475 RepID=UPI002110A0E6|nr:uncharacterized protein C12orf76 homolog [Suncus etruscus]